MMNANYEYIISSLPDISLDWKYGENASFTTYVSWIRTQLDASDNRTLDTLLEGFDDSNLNQEFYSRVTAAGNRFIREYFTFDLNVRNGKARFLNKAFGRPAETDTINIPAGEFAEAGKLEAALASTDLLQRESSLDQLMWDKITEITTFNYFDIEAVLAFVAKLHIIDRWLALDEAAGKEKFRSLVNEVRGTFKGVEYVEPKD
ncbi:MAG: DUF2764 family protein [Candidatus Cryptobacteroides sp.]